MHAYYKNWLWRFCIEEMALWRRFITKKYGLLNQWTTEAALGTSGCSVWKTFRRLWTQFNVNISFRVGDGVKIVFWNELRIGDDTLRSIFPQLYIISLQKNATVSQFGASKGGT